MLAAGGTGIVLLGMDYESLSFVYAVMAALFAGVVAWKSFGYVAGNLRRRREDPPDDRDPDAGD